MIVKGKLRGVPVLSVTYILYLCTIFTDLRHKILEEVAKPKGLALHALGLCER